MWTLKEVDRPQPVALVTWVFSEVVQVISVQEHIFLLFEVAEQSFEGN